MNGVLRLEWRIAALKNGLQDATAYRLEFLFEILGAAVVPAAIQMLIWYALFKQSGATEVAGMSYRDVILYTLASLLFSQIRGGDLDFELSEMIRSGTLSNYLLRPVSVIEFVFIRGLAPKLFIAGLCLALGLAAAIPMGMSAGHLFGAMFLALIGNVIHYQLSAALSAMAFVWEDATSTLMVKNMIVSLLSGELIPLNLFPHSMQWIWKVTPFYLYVFGPVEYALGRWSNEQFLRNLGIAGAWLVGGAILVRVSWGLGIRRYQGMGN